MPLAGFRLFHLLTILAEVATNLATPNQPAKVLELDGDIILGGLFPVHRRSKETENACGGIDPHPGFQYLAAMLFAIQEINNDSSLLSNITLGAKIYDTCRSQTIGADRAKDLITYTLTNRKAPLAGVIGPFVSDVSIAVANLLRVFEIPQISYGSTSVDLSNKELYSNFFRTVPPDSFQAHAMVDILKHHEWKYIFTVNSYGNYGQKGMAELQKAASASDICIASSAQLPSLPNEKDFDHVIKTFLETRTQHSDNLNVIVLFTTQADSEDILRAAMKINATQFTWVGSNGWSNRVDVTDGNEEVAEGSLTINHLEGDVPRFDVHFKNMKPKGNEFNPWFEEFWEDIFKCSIPGGNMDQENLLPLCQNDQTLPPGIELAPVRVVINAVYAMAHALHNLQQVYCPGVIGMCDRMRNEFQRNDLLNFLRNVTFPDASLNFSIRFNQNQEMDGVYDIKSFQKAAGNGWNYVNVASWGGTLLTNNTVHGNLTINDSLLRWKSNKRFPPSSYCSKPCNNTQIRKRRLFNPTCCWDCITCEPDAIIENDTCQPCPPGHTPDSTLSHCDKLQPWYPKWSSAPSIVFVFICSIGILATAVTAVFFIKRRKHHVIKASARELCAILFIGIASCFLAPFIYLSKPSDTVCGLRRFFGNVCLTTCYAPLLLKTIRIFRIFKSARSSVSRPLFTSPRSQVLISLGLIIVQVLLSTLWNISDAPRAQEVYPSRSVVILECATVNAYTLAITLSYNSLLMLLCTIFAFKTRNYPRNFNEAKYIGISMYLICVMWISSITIYLTAPDSFWRVYLVCMTLIVTGTIMLFGLLVPKMFILIFTNGQGPTVDESYSAPVTQPNTTNNRRLSPTIFGLQPQWICPLDNGPDSQLARGDPFLAVRRPAAEVREQISALLPSDNGRALPAAENIS